MPVSGVAACIYIVYLQIVLLAVVVVVVVAGLSVVVFILVVVQCKEMDLYLLTTRCEEGVN